MSVVPRVIDRYALYDEMAAGGMATVHYGRLVGPVGFARTVAMKRLHPQFAKDPEFVTMFVDEARLAARITHPNVVRTIDIVACDGELVVVMEYVQGETLSRLERVFERRNERMPVRIALAVVAGALHGLHAAHEARSERGEPLHIVHRDVSPQNVIVGVDGTPRVLDFGVAKAVGRSTATREGQLKGKMAYMAPEQLAGDEVDRRTDVFAASVMLWEALAGRRLFQASSDAATLLRLLNQPIQPPSEWGFGAGLAHDEALVAAIDAIVMRGLEREPAARWPTARDMAIAIENLLPLPTAREVGEWVEQTAATALAQRSARIAAIEAGADRVEPGGPSMRAAAAATPPTDRPGSDVTGVTLARPAPRGTAAAASYRGPLMVATALLAVALVALIVVAFRLGPAQVSAPAAGTPDTARAPSPASALAARPDDPTPSDPSASARKEAAVPTATERSSPAPIASAAAPAHAGRVPRAPPRTAPPVAGGCTPPYTVSADGIRRFKPECL